MKSVQDGKKKMAHFENLEFSVQEIGKIFCSFFIGHTTSKLPNGPVFETGGYNPWHLTFHLRIPEDDSEEGKLRDICWQS